VGMTTSNMLLVNRMEARTVGRMIGMMICVQWEFGSVRNID
jgi:hypothetical protein